MIDPAIVQQVAASLSYMEKRAIEELCCGYGRGPSHLSANLQISKTKARTILQKFRREGICDYGYLSDEDDGMLRGKGYWLDSFGLAVREHINPKQP